MSLLLALGTKFHMALAGMFGGVLHYFFAAKRDVFLLGRDLVVGGILGFYTGPAFVSWKGVSEEIGFFVCMALGSLGMSTVIYFHALITAAVKARLKGEKNGE